MKAVIIEDSKLAVLELKELLSTFEHIDIVGQAGDVVSAIELIHSIQPDLVFLDINMPGGDGFDVLEGLDYSPQVIFTTAYDEYAIKSFEFNALDYLLKPINSKRLAAALAKVKPPTVEVSSVSATEKPLTGDDKIFVRHDTSCWLVELNKVRLFESEGNNSALLFEEHRACVPKSLNKVEQRLSGDNFIRINRQQIINLDFVETLNLEENGGLLMTLNCGLQVSTSRRAAGQIKQMMSL